METSLQGFDKAGSGVSGTVNDVNVTGVTV